LAGVGLNSSPHSAAGQAAGYQYQAERALLELVRRQEVPLALYIERLDDFHLEAQGGALEIIQVKHHLGSGGDLADASVDLWRTINAWITVIETRDYDELPTFLLLSTSTASQGSAAALLRRENRDEDTALQRLREVAGASRSATTKDWRRRFVELAPDRQQALIQSITVGDQQPQLVDIDDALKAEFALHVRSEHLDAFVARLKEWWYGVVALMLTGRQEAITADDLRQFLWDLRDGFSLNSLPFVYDVPEPTDEESARYVASKFTAQLRLVDVIAERITMAIGDYHRAYTNSSRWSKEGLVLAGELGRYERKLCDEWNRHFLRMQQQIGSEASEALMRVAGRELWERLDMDTPLPRLRQLDERIAQGTLHKLADREEVGWHPEFKARLRELLETAA
jgi:hypothetical protein